MSEVAIKIDRTTSAIALLTAALSRRVRANDQGSAPAYTNCFSLALETSANSF